MYVSLHRCLKMRTRINYISPTGFINVSQPTRIIIYTTYTKVWSYYFCVIFDKYFSEGLYFYLHICFHFILKTILCIYCYPLKQNEHLIIILNEFIYYINIKFYFIFWNSAIIYKNKVFLFCDVINVQKKK